MICILLAKYNLEANETKLLLSVMSLRHASNPEMGHNQPSKQADSTAGVECPDLVHECTMSAWVEITMQVQGRKQSDKTWRGLSACRMLY